MKAMPIVHKRRPYVDEEPNGYLESDRDWAENNWEALSWFEENAEEIRRILQEPTEKGENKDV